MTRYQVEEQLQDGTWAPAGKAWDTMTMAEIYALTGRFTDKKTRVILVASDKVGDNPAAK